MNKPGYHKEYYLKNKIRLLTEKRKERLKKLGRDYLAEKPKQEPVTLETFDPRKSQKYLSCLGDFI